MTEEKSKARFALTGAVIAAVTASLCCILPLIAAVIGFTGFAAAQFFEHWRPCFLAITFILLAAGFYLAYRKPGEACEVGSLCERTPIRRWNRTALWLAAVLVVVLAAFPYYSGGIARAVTKTGASAEALAQSSQARVVLIIDGMYCSSCAVLLGKHLTQIPGVRGAEVSFEKKQAIFDYDPHRVDVQRLAKSITDAGYKVAGSATAAN
jgi:copper chaperone CopZ